METEVLLRIIAIVIAGGILVSTVSWADVVTKIKTWFKRTPKPEVKVAKDETSFLEIIESWHTLRHQCDIYGLTEAVEKIDEVFPLLNVEEEDRNA
jgi:hypothetical protein